MILNLSIVITFFFGAIIGGPVKEENARFSLEDLWKSSGSDCSSKRKAVWLDGVQKYYDDIIEAFNKFPSSLLVQSDTDVVSPFRDYLSKLVKFSNSKSKILSSGSTEILGVLSKVKLGTNSPIGVIREFNRMLPILTKTYRDVISNLSGILGGEHTCAAKNAMSDLECYFKQYMKAFPQDDASGSYKKVDSEPFKTQAQKFKNTISLIGENALSNCELSTSDVQDALEVLRLVLDHLIICTHGLSRKKMLRDKNVKSLLRENK